MCGIVGFFNNNTNPEQINKIIENMNNAQIHRGPNGTDKFINDEKNLGLMVCRLSILDLEFCKQPMHSEDKRYTIIFNATILNSPELRKEMEEKTERKKAINEGRKKKRKRKKEEGR